MCCRFFDTTEAGDVSSSGARVICGYKLPNIGAGSSERVSSSDVSSCIAYVYGISFKTLYKKCAQSAPLHIGL